MALRVFDKNDADRFWKKVAIAPNTTECWLWAGKPNEKGYGRFGAHYNVYLAHRVAYELTFGTIPANLYVCHKCDNPPCCNPHHFFLGSLADNNRDMREKGRGHDPPAKKNKTSFTREQVTGVKNSKAKLSEGDVRELRNLRQAGVLLKDLANRYGLSIASAHKAAVGKSYTEVC